MIDSNGEDGRREEPGDGARAAYRPKWTFYKRDEKRIAEVKRTFRSAW